MTKFHPHILPIPLRGEHCVFIANIPWDFTREEAQRVAAVIEAFAAGAESDVERPAPAEPQTDTDAARKD